jgi:uncharacterized protein
MQKYSGRTFPVYILIVAFFLTAQVALGQDPLPDLTARVTDQTGTLSDSEIQTLSRKLEQFEQSKGSQIAILILPTTGDETIEGYGIRLAEKWKLGRDGVDDGVILLVAKADRKVRIEVGYGLEGAIPDAYAKRIIERIIIPEFRAGHFFDGINEATDAMISLANEEDLPVVTSEETTSTRASRKGFGGLVFFGIFIYFILLGVLSKRLGKFKGSLVTILLFSIITAIAAGIGAAIIVAIITSIMALFTGGGGGGIGGGRHYGGGFIGGGLGRGGSFGGGGGFGGGFSGGGGSFGGGGASGGW